MMKYIPLCFLALAAPAHAASVSISCPEEIQTRQQGDIPRGWQSFVDKVNTRYRLSHIDLYDGPPEQLALLKPDNGDDEDSGPDYWTLGGTDNIYAVCSYGSTSIRLAKRIERSVERCAVTEYDGMPRGVSCE